MLVKFAAKRVVQLEKLQIGDPGKLINTYPVEILDEVIEFYQNKKIE